MKRLLIVLAVIAALYGAGKLGYERGRLDGYAQAMDALYDSDACYCAEYDCVAPPKTAQGEK